MNITPFYGELDAPSDTIQNLISAITGRESGGDTEAVSPDGARGSMQIMEPTFNQYAKSDEDYGNDGHRRAAATRKIIDDFVYYGGDLEKTAAAYIGGRGAVRKDGSIRDDVTDSLGTNPAAYAQQVLKRMGGAAPKFVELPDDAEFTPLGGGAGRGSVNPTAKGILSSSKFARKQEAETDAGGNVTWNDSEPLSLHADAATQKELDITKEIQRLRPINPGQSDERLRRLAESTYDPTVRNPAFDKDGNSTAKPYDARSDLDSRVDSLLRDNYGGDNAVAKSKFDMQFNADQAHKKAVVQADGLPDRVSIGVNQGSQNSQAYIDDARSKGMSADSYMEETEQKRRGYQWAEDNPVGQSVINFDTTIADTARNLGVGFVSGTNKALGNAIEIASTDHSTINEFGKEYGKFWKDQQKEWSAPERDRGTISSALVDTAGMVGQAAPLVALGLMQAPALVTFGATALLFGGTSYVDKRDQLKENGKSDEDARNAGLVAAAINTVGLHAASMVTAALGGIIAPVVAKNPTVNSVIDALTKTDVVKEFSKALGRSFVSDSAIFSAQGLANRELDKSYQLPVETIESTLKSSLKSAAAFSFLSGAPMAAHSVARASSTSNKFADALSNPDAKPEDRAQAAMTVAVIAKNAGVPELDVKGWLKGANQSIYEKTPITSEFTPYVPLSRSDKEEVWKRAAGAISSLNEIKNGRQGGTTVDPETGMATLDIGTPGRDLTEEESNLHSFLSNAVDPTTSRRDGTIGIDHELLADASGYKAKAPDPIAVITDPSLTTVDAVIKATNDVMGAHSEDLVAKAQQTASGLSEVEKMNIGRDAQKALNALLAKGELSNTEAQHRDFLADALNPATEKTDGMPGVDHPELARYLQDNPVVDPAIAPPVAPVIDAPVLSENHQFISKLNSQSHKAVISEHLGLTGRETPEEVLSLIDQMPANKKAAMVDAIGKRQVTAYEPPANGIELPGVVELRKLAEGFNQKIILTQGDGPNGLFAPDGTILINVNSKKALTAILGHELGHRLQNENPILYQALVDHLKPFIAESAVKNVMKSYGWEDTQSNRTKATHELVNDLAGNRMSSESFWKAGKAKNPTLFAALAQHVKAIMADAKRALFDSGLDKTADLQSINDKIDLVFKTHFDLEEKPHVENAPTSGLKQQTNNPLESVKGVVELPVKDLKLSNDVPQFKSDAGSNGVTSEGKLEGKYDRALAAPIQVWKRLDGSYEVISGRHRLDLAQRSGETTVPVQIHNESDGFTADNARVLDIELNVKDGRGKVKDYVAYFREAKIGRDEAKAEGLLNTAIGRSAYTIADSGSEALIAAHANHAISDQAAFDIAQNAPNNEALQNLGIRYVVDGKSINEAVNIMRAAKAAGFRGGDSGDMFGFDDSQIKEAIAVANQATKQIRDAKNDLSAVVGAVKKPETAKKLGVDVKDPVATQAKIDALRQRVIDLEGFATNPEVYAQLRKDAGLPEVKIEHPVEEHEDASVIDDQTESMFSLNGDAKQDDLLSSYDRQEALDKQNREEEAKAKEDRLANQKPLGKKVTADQVDLFNPQDSLFSLNDKIPDVSDDRLGPAIALLHAGKSKDLYRLPISHADRLEDIATAKGMTAVNSRDANAENAEFAKGVEVDDPNDPMGELGRSNLRRLMSASNEAKSTSGNFRTWDVTTDKGAKGVLTQDGNKVWINVAGDNSNKGGSSIYDLAANYAHNNKLIFIGDPQGLSDLGGMRRRLANMLNAAVKYQSTDFLEPHAKQFLGDKSIGMPGLKWTKGDTLSNIRSMMDASVASNEHAQPIAHAFTEYAPRTQSYEDGFQGTYNDKELSELLESDGRERGDGKGGFTTLKRTSFIKSLLRGQDERRAVLDRLRTQQDGGADKPSGASAESWYSLNSDTESQAFKKWSNDAPVVESHQAESYNFNTGEKVVVEAYHGTGRGDRVGTVFQRKRATSGPMAFFTSSPELASGYATGKADTSRGLEDNPYESWFKFKPQGQRTPVSIDRAWYQLTPEQRATVRERMPDIRQDDDGNIIYEKDGGDIGSYDWNLKQTQKSYDRSGNPLKAAVETWLNSGTVYGNEQEFMHVLKLAGFPVKDVEFDHPHETFPFVYKTMIAMQKPLVAGDIPAEVVDALNAAAKKDRSRAQSGGVDTWDKNTRTLKEWVAAFHEPENKYVWTSIPDKVTEVFKSLGYDGIIDYAGKGGGHEHPVYIPFSETQVKSDWNKGTFDAGKKNIHFSLNDETRTNYDARIDHLMSGGKADRQGVKILDRSDVMGLLKFPDFPVHLQESKVTAGLKNHNLTVQDWKSLPDWLDHPAMVFKSDTVDGRYVFLAPKLANNGAPITMIVEPNAKSGSTDVHLLVNAYDKDSGKVPFARWAKDGLLQYVDKKESPTILAASGLQLPGVLREVQGFGRSIATERTLSNFVAQRDANQQQTGDKDAGFKSSYSLNDDNPIWKSALKEGIDSLNYKALPANGWVDALKSLTNKGKVKQEEIEWSGINDFLKMQDGKVTKEQVQQFLDGNGVRVEETTLGSPESVHSVQQKYEAEMIRQGATEAQAEQMFNSMLAHSRDSLHNEEKKDKGYEMIMSSGKFTGNEIHDAAGGGTDTKFSQYVVPGGENYREVLLTLPESKAKTDADRVLRGRMEYRKDDEGNWNIWDSSEFVFKKGFKTREEVESYANEDDQLTSIPHDRGYKSSHWDQPNVLAHLRLDDRTDADGNKTLFVQEIQSDWGQGIKKDGVATPETARIKGEARIQHKAKENPDPAWGDIDSKDDWAVHWEDGTFSGGYSEQSAKEVAAKGKSNAKSGLPNGPFVGRTEGWLNLALKRVIKLAVDGGYDKVAFANGEQNAGHYDLSKQISKIHLFTDPVSAKGKASIEPSSGRLIAYDLDGNRTVDKDVSFSELPDIIGKDAADKLIGSDPFKGVGYAGADMRELDGLDLKTGGEGMKTFYDKIVPNTTNALLKKLGGGKVESIEFDTRKPEDNSYYEEPTDADFMKQPGFTITETMRDNSAGGMPMFSLAEPSNAAEAFLSESIRGIAPMSGAPTEARAVIKQFANDRRLASYHMQRFDHFLEQGAKKGDFDLVKMWNAADQENDLRRNMTPPSQRVGLGLASLNPKERQAVEAMHKHGQDLFDRAKLAGMITGDGVPYWTPRMMVMVDAQTGEFSVPVAAKGTGGGGEDGLKFGTKSSNLMKRNYDLAADTEAAMQAKGGELVRNIRAMPMAMARLENAIAGRELVNQIKTTGQMVGQEWISTSMKDGFVVAKNPAFVTMRPQFETDSRGQPIKDQFGHLIPKFDAGGDPILDKHQMYVRKDIDSALRAALSSNDGVAYTAMMLLKSKAMSAIMVSPLIHDMVIAGKAVASLGYRLPDVWYRGGAARRDTELVSKAIKNGLVLVAQHGKSTDVTDLASPIGKEGGYGDMDQSWIALGLRDALKMAGMPKAGEAVKSGIDKVGEFWHGTLLWNRIADLQMGIFQHVHDKLVAEGKSDTEASIMAAHMGNRYGGSLPKENMSEFSRKAANLILFSRSFTLGNIGIFKDIATGLPAGEKALLLKEMGAGKDFDSAVNQMRRKAFSGLILDIGLAYMMTSLVQDAIDEKNKNRSWTDIAGDYKTRAGEYVDRIKANPTKLTNYDPVHLMSQGGNEPGKETRARLGLSDTNREVYLRVPTGKVAEELMGWTSHPMDLLSNKLSPTLKSIYQSAVNDKGFGRPIYEEESGRIVKLAAIAKHILGAHLNYDTAQTAVDVIKGKGTDIDKLKLAGTATGMTPSQGYPGGQEAGVMNKVEQEYKQKIALATDEAHRYLKYGLTDKAYDLLESKGMPPREISAFIRHYENHRLGTTKAQNKRFNQHATPDQRELMDNLR